MTDNFEGWRVTVLMRPKYSFGHNLRLKDYVETQKHIDPTREHGVILHMGNERETYSKIFSESIKEHNKGKRKDRQITDYYQKVLDDERSGKHKNPKANSKRQPFYEIQFYIGNRDSHCPDEKAKKVLSAYITKVLPQKYPNFIPTSITWHNDEFSYNRKGERLESPLHFHVVGVFTAHALSAEELKKEMEYREEYKEVKKAELKAKGITWDEKKWKEKEWRKGMIQRWGKALEKGMPLQSSMSAASNEMGFFTEKGIGTAQQQFEEDLRHDLMDFCEEMGIKINRKKGRKHSHLNKEDYAEEEKNFEWSKELKEKEKLLEAKEIALADKIDDFDYRIEHIEEIEKELSNKKNNLELKEEQLNKESVEVNTREKNLALEKSLLERKERNLAVKQRIQAEKEEKLSRDEKYLDSRKKKLDEQDAKQSEREKRILQGEAPLLQKEKELADREKTLIKNESELQTREKLADEKLKTAEEKENIVKEELAQIQTDKQLIEHSQDVMQKQYDENQKQIDIFNAENRSKIIEIDNWKEASEQIKDTESWITNVFKEFHANRHRTNAVEDLYNKIKTGISAVIVKVKEAYDKKINELNEKLFGHKRIFTAKDQIICEYNFGEKDYADMLRDTPVDDIQKAIDETKKRGRNTFAEAAKDEKNELDFYERHFEKAKTLRRERLLELERERQHTHTR